MKVELKANEYYFFIWDCSKEYSLNRLPWGNEVFDVMILIFNESFLSSDSVTILAKKLVAANTDWIDVLGPKSEWVHDQIDLASVRVGRQDAVGDGSPMTGWDEDIKACEEFAEDVSGGGPGGQGNKLICVLGDSNDFNLFVSELKKKLEEND